jgi:hypothetical protein
VRSIVVAARKNGAHHEHLRKHHVVDLWSRQCAAGTALICHARQAVRTDLFEREPQVDVAAVLTELAAKNKEKLDWRNSIVDLMKLLKLDSGLSARKELAKELHYTGDASDSAAMNIWLHKQVMIELAENGGKVPDSLKA